MNTTAKMTYVDALTVALTKVDGEVAEKLTALRDQLVKRNSADRKPTAKQTENSQLKVEIVNFMENASPMTISEMVKNIPCLSEMSNQRVSAIVRQLVSDNILDRQEIKRKAYFSVKVAE